MQRQIRLQNWYLISSSRLTFLWSSCRVMALLTGRLRDLLTCASGFQFCSALFVSEKRARAVAKVTLGETYDHNHHINSNTISTIHHIITPIKPIHIAYVKTRNSLIQFYLTFINRFRSFPFVAWYFRRGLFHHFSPSQRLFCCFFFVSFLFLFLTKAIHCFTDVTHCNIFKKRKEDRERKWWNKPRRKYQATNGTERSRFINVK